MANIFSRSAAIAAALALTVCFSGCGSKSSSSSSAAQTATSVNPVSQYGGDMVKHWAKDGYEITVEVDGRFVTEDESKKVAKYIAAIGKCDGKLMEEALHPAALKYVLDANGCSDAAGYASKLHKQLMQFTGEDFVFDYTTVEEYVDESTGFDFSKYDKIILDAEPDAKITNRKRLSVDALYDDSKKSTNYRMGGYIDVYMYTIDGVPYVLS